MKVKVLGTGCAKCNKLYALAAQAISNTGAPAELAKQAPRFVTLGEAEAESMADLGEAAAGGDAEAFDGISARMGENAAESDAIAIAMGATSCTANS